MIQGHRLMRSRRSSRAASAIAMRATRSERDAALPLRRWSMLNGRSDHRMIERNVWRPEFVADRMLPLYVWVG